MPPGLPGDRSPRAVSGNVARSTSGRAVRRRQEAHRATSTRLSTFAQAVRRLENPEVYTKGYRAARWAVTDESGHDTADRRIRTAERYASARMDRPQITRLTASRLRFYVVACERSGWLVRKLSCRWKNTGVVDPADLRRGSRG